MWLETFDFESEKIKQSEILDPLPRFKNMYQVNITNGFMSCSFKFWNRYGIDCPHVYHVKSQLKQFKESNHHHISLRWCDSFHQF